MLHKITLTKIRIPRVALFAQRKPSGGGGSKPTNQPAIMLASGGYLQLKDGSLILLKN